MVETVAVEFVGLPSPYSYPDVQQMLARTATTREERRLKADLRRSLVQQERKRQMQGFARFSGRIQLTMGPRQGLSREYVWGPHTWVVEMDPHDVEVLMQLHDKHREAFRVRRDVIRLGAA